MNRTFSLLTGCRTGLAAVCDRLAALLQATPSSRRGARPAPPGFQGTGRDAEEGGGNGRADMARRLQEVRALDAETPLTAWLAYTRGTEATPVRAHARRAIAARATLHADLSELLRGSGSTEAMTYLCEELSTIGPEFRDPVRAALRRLPDQLRRLFRDSSGVREDMGFPAVRLALATIDKFGAAERTGFLPEIAELRRTFAFAPRVRCVCRGSRFVEEKIRVYDAERLLDSWIRQNPVARPAAEP